MNPDAMYAVLALCSENMFDDGGHQNLEPAFDSRIGADWALRDYLVATDGLFRKGARIELDIQKVYYGFVAESKTLAGTFAVVIRGTDGMIEWVEDGEGLARAHPVAGLVEDGFFGIYGSMTLAGTDASLMSGLQRLIGSGRAIVVGHSLGAAIAHYVAVDLAGELLTGRTSLRAIAPPHPGDLAFANLVGDRIRDARAYANTRDRVPMVPPSFPFMTKYTAIANRIELDPSGIIRDDCHDGGWLPDYWCHHHALSYLRLIGGPEGLALAGKSPPYLDCIIQQS